jgi:hypothetical protein
LFNLSWEIRESLELGAKKIENLCKRRCAVQIFSILQRREVCYSPESPARTGAPARQSETNMTKIDANNRFLLQMTEQISAVARQEIAAKRPETARRKQRPGEPSLGAVILQRVSQIDPALDDRRRKAFRVFLESVLAHELGDDLLADPTYHQVVDKVHETMQRNPAVSAAMERAGEYLINAANSGKDTDLGI